MRYFFNNYGVVELQQIVTISLRSTLLGLLNIHLHTEPRILFGATQV
jgi:hypothetical protein